MNTAVSIAHSSSDSDCAKQSLTLMERYNVAPVPEHYAVWFHYVAGKNKDLVREVDTIIKNSLAFTTETNSYLYYKFIAANQGQRAALDAAAGSQKILSEVLKIINDFSGETKNYNKNVDQYLDDISDNITDSSVKNIVKQLIEKTAGLKESGNKLNEKLEESAKEITDLRKNLQQVTTEAQRDFLTGVFNRKTFEKMFDEQVRVLQEHPAELCLLMVDIDHFKNFNDRYGHLIGDEVLKTVARTLTDTLKGRDVVARFGGEEFVIILPDTPVEGALKVADLIRGAIAGKELKRKDTGESFGVITVSMGVARYRSETDTLPTLIKRADDALYISKRNGRNRVTCES